MMKKRGIKNRPKKLTVGGIGDERITVSRAENAEVRRGVERGAKGARCLAAGRLRAGWSVEFTA